MPSSAGTETEKKNKKNANGFTQRCRRGQTVPTGLQSSSTPVFSTSGPQNPTHDNNSLLLFHHFTWLINGASPRAVYSLFLKCEAFITMIKNTIINVCNTKYFSRNINHLAALSSVPCGGSGAVFPLFFPPSHANTHFSWQTKVSAQVFLSNGCLRISLYVGT